MNADNNFTFDFRGARMTLKLSTGDTSGAYAVMEMVHPPNVGPALHLHPRGPESFYILEGSYTFYRDSETLYLTANEAITIPAGVPHRYTVGSQGGRALVICPPGLENYFQEVSRLLQETSLSSEEEFTIASRHGQVFLDSASHWGIN